MISIVVPTIGRPSLRTLLDRLRPQLDSSPVPVELIVVWDDDAAGPAATRNEGWRKAAHEWVVFLDDDVLPATDWLAALVADLDQPADVGGVQGILEVPAARRPDDWAANTARLADAAWVTADMAYRRSALLRVGGFDERFPRAYREDADLAYRVRLSGWRLVRGRRRTAHPVRPESPWVSVRTQRGNADDALLRRLYGPRWHEKLEAPRGRRRRHAVVTACGVAALAGAVGALVRPRPARALATLAGLGWLAGTIDFAAHRRRLAPASRPVPLLITSVLIPPLAVGYWLAGWVRHRNARPVRESGNRYKVRQ
jgi:glycosyltransferase involved in cell wall biosynthesis